MPIYNGKIIENLTPVEALIKGYFTQEDMTLSSNWIAQDYKARHRDTIVYVNGRYVGVAKNNTTLHKIIEKFKL